MIWLGILYSNLYGYPWPVKDFNTQHQISGTVGEYRTDPALHFHAGVDIPWPQSDSIFAVDSGIVDSVNKWVGRFRYMHIDFKINNNDTLGPGNFIGLVNYPLAPHVHFREAPDSSNRTPVVNNLFSGALTPYVDSTNPYIDSIKFYRQGPGDTLLHKDSLDRKVDVLAVTRDTRTDSTGHVPAVPGTTSVYRIGYVVKDTSGNIKKTYWEKIKFDTIPNPSSSSQLNLTYGSGSSSSHFRYWVSNDPFNSNSDLRNWYWNTKQDSAGADSVDADSIEDAKFKDGFYWVKIYAYDIRSNADSESVYVHVDNFNPRVKETYPTDSFAFVPNKLHKVWCSLSEPMDTTTLTATNIKIQSLKADSFNYTITNFIYDDSIYKLTLEVDSFRFKDTVQVRLLDGVKDLAGKSIDTTGSEQTIAYFWTFVVGVIQLTDNDLTDVYPDVYHGKVVWTQAPGLSDLGEIMLYDFYNNTTTQISPGGGIHNTPHIYENEVAWIGYGWGSTNPVYYYDGSTTQQIAQANRGRYSMEISEGGVVWRAYYGDYYPDTIWIEYYNPDSDQVYLLDEFLDREGRLEGRVDIDGNEIVWDHDMYPQFEREIYYYCNGDTQNFSSDTSQYDGTPDISYGQIAWLKQNGINEVWFYDGTNKRKIAGIDDWNPQLHNGSIAWIKESGMYSPWHLKLYDGRDTLELMTENGIGYWPFLSVNIHNNQVVWLRIIGTSYYATCYDGNETMYLTVEPDSLNPGDSYRIEAHDGFVVYDAWDGNDYEIYLYIGDTLFTPPAVVKNLRNEIIEAKANDKQVKLTWSPNSESDLAGYKIYRSDTSYQYDTIPYDSVLAADTIFIDTIPLDGYSYYVVTAFDNLNNEGGFSNQTVAFISDTIPPSPPANLVASYDSINQMDSLIWNAPSDPDLELYRIYRSTSSGSYTTPLDSVFDPETTFVDSTILLGQTYYYVVTAVDTAGNESSYSNEDTVTVPFTVFSDFELATGFNNASRIVRNPSTGEIFLAYSTISDTMILCISSTDEGVTWSRSVAIASGMFPTLVMTTDNDPCCIYGLWVGPGFGEARLYYTKYVNNHWTTPSLLFSVDSVYMADAGLAIPTPSAWFDSEDTMHIVWNSPMGKDYIHRFAVWYGNLYSLDTLPSFSYMQLDTIWTYEKSRWTYSASIRPALAVDDQDVIHVAHETDPGSPWLRYRYRDNGVWSEKPKNDTFGLEGSYYPDLESFGDRLHLAWDYRYPDTTYDHAICYRNKTVNGWDTVMTVYEPLPFNQFGNPVNAGGWYTIWANEDVCYSQFNGATWEDPETVQVTTEFSAHPTVLFRQDGVDTCLYIAWTEGDSAPYTIEFEKVTVQSVPRYYDNLGQATQSVYCLSRDGYEDFGDKAYEEVDRGKHKVSYRFTDLDPDKSYRLDVSYYFEDKKESGDDKIDIGLNKNLNNSTGSGRLETLQRSKGYPERGDSLVLILEVNSVPIDTSCVYNKEVTRVSVYLPESLYEEKQIDIEVKRNSGDYAVCGEIGLYEFPGEGRDMIPVPRASGGPQSNETLQLGPVFFEGIYPNPARGNLRIRFNSPDEQKVTIKLYDVTGRLVNEIFNGKAKIGINEMPIMAENYAAGIYFIRIETNKEIITEKFIMLK